MKYYEITTHFVICDQEDPVEVIDKWLKEAVENYEHPSSQFNRVAEIVKINYSAGGQVE